MSLADALVNDLLGGFEAWQQRERSLLWNGTPPGFPMRRIASLSAQAVVSICSGGDFAPKRDMEEVYTLFQTRDQDAIRAELLRQQSSLRRILPAPTTGRRRTRRLFLRAMMRHCGQPCIFGADVKPPAEPVLGTDIP